MLPRTIVIANNNMDTFSNTVFPDLHQNLSNTEYLTERAILTPQNSDVAIINHNIGESIQGVNSVEDEEEARLFPTTVRLCFFMTINKTQRQTLKKVGIFLPGPVFTHGQLYVA
ncbi:hypothetical protein O9G_005717 [Rozella allomycis CSF55]|uniref:Uncharacterized protein n=1 Tax=Rozella allomycis (strain CSF55) TaxID=988480 RepID=A0A075AWS8_ROZAC|nr:hypothetical protein O9G_005717 [Rozella allomycis CSF55]|eukprot:EPZ34572.1 hypothetical protein O9G_005717 [Rozella allomycis CSF55]